METRAPNALINVQVLALTDALSAKLEILSLE
jgi:hypothetical protein